MLALLLGNLSLHIQSTVDESHNWFLTPPGLQDSTVWEWWPSNCCSKQEAPTLKRTGFQFVCLCSPFLQTELVPPWGGGTHKTQEADSRLMISVSSSQFPSNKLISLWSFSWFSEACIHGYPRSKLQCKLVTCKWKLASPMFFFPNYQSVFRLEQESSCQDLVALSKYQVPKKQASLELCFPITCGNSYLYLYQTSKDKAFIPRNPSFLLPKSVSFVRSHKK